MIPKVIFQTWKKRPASNEIRHIMNTWSIMNPGYDMLFYDDEACCNFLKRFDRRVYQSYKKIIPGAFKADLWRYCVLFEFGGFYCDIDTICLGSIDEFIAESVSFTAPIDLNLGCSKHNLFNSFIGAEPRSSIMKDCIERIVFNVENMITNIDPLDFSACGVLGRSVNRSLGVPDTESFLGREGQDGSCYFFAFDRNEEFVGDPSGRKLFQNKNGNNFVKNAYEKECSSSNVVSWAKFEKWIIKNPIAFL